MTLSMEVAGQVPGQIQRKGRSYFQSRAVRILDGAEDYVDAEVRGSSLYEVGLFRKGQKLQVGCSCPYFQQNLDVCKHIWATLLATDDQGYLQGAGRSARRGHLTLEPDETYIDDYSPEDNYDDEGEEAWEEPRPPVRLSSPRKKKRKKAPAPSWKKQLSALRQSADNHDEGASTWPADREIFYIVDQAATMEGKGLVLEIASREKKQNGDWAKPKARRVEKEDIPHLPDAGDRQILSLLLGAQQQVNYGGYYSSNGYSSSASRWVFSKSQQEALFPMLAQTGRFWFRPDELNADLVRLAWDDGPAWQFWLEVAKNDAQHYELTGTLRRGSERIPLAQPRMLTEGGMVFWPDRVSRLDDQGAFAWVNLLRQQKMLTIPCGQKQDFLEELFRVPRLPYLDLPPELHFEEARPQPRPRLKVKADKKNYGNERLAGELSFDYDGVIVGRFQPGRHLFEEAKSRLIHRDLAAENAAAALLKQLGFKTQSYYYDSKPTLELVPRNLPRVVRTLLAAGWLVEAEGKLYRTAGDFNIQVKSGIDWFELHGEVQFGDTVARLPQLLEAVRRGDNLVQLDDGTFGMLPEAWLKKYGLLAGLGKVKDDHLQFSRTQVGLLDALLAAQEKATCDEAFDKARAELRRFDGIQPADPPPEFVGQLRPYQNEGLGWLQFLQRFGFGGCLADDMGLGKTVQVLALLASRKSQNGKSRPGPSLVIMPRSLVFNWKQEAARFTPQLRILDHTGLGRLKPGEHFQDFDVILTTYGTLRNDVVEFKDVVFDYCILDESQAIKNANSQSAKAVRLLQAHHRLAMSGTPVENHLGELWSLFEYLNPGMLGQASVFRLTGTAARCPEPETRALLAKALRPFILRRTKDQVAKDLPQKSEQTLYCEMDTEQRKLYDELRAYYRNSLLDKIQREGINKAKIQILEALLRLRQAACHPGLLDKKKLAAPSAKLDMLLPQLAEVFEEGHKVLVFSQFTSLLAIVRDRLDKDKIPYEYLDGKTRDRAARVEHFQSDPDCKLFLISLKAGGLGLNLTAAEYVFLLDPWWNPAVETQAIDRAHRIGQTRPVFAYRLICRDTVEEKVLELQKTKRALADAIITADNSLITNLDRQDLELLLS